MPLSETPGVLFSTRNESASGQSVDADSALSLSAIFAGVNFLSEIISSLPLRVIRQEGDRKEPARTHRAYAVLGWKPNPWMTGKTARKVMEWNRLLGGKACAEIQWDMGGNVVAYWPLEYWRVQEKYDDDGLYYWIDCERRVEVEDMIYVPLTSCDGVEGVGFLDYAIESLGLSLSAQECAALFFGNGSRASGILKHPGNPSKEQRAEFRKTWEETHGGRNQHKVAVMYGGWEYQPDTGNVPPDNAQLLESRKFSVEEAARWLNLPPNFLGDLTHATFSNIEEQGINLVIYALSPILVGYEQEFDRKLLSPPTLYSKHNVHKLLQGNHKAQGEFYKIMSMIGVYSVNDICDIEDRNPIGPMGDIRFVQANMKTLEQAQHEAANPGGTKPTAPVTEAESSDAEGDDDATDPEAESMADRAALLAMVTDTVQRMLKKEANAVTRAAAKPESFLSWIDSFYLKHADTISEALCPAASSLRPSLAAEIVAVHAARIVERSKRDLLEVAGRASAKKLPAAVDAMLANWASDRPSAHAADFMEELTNARA